MNDSTELWTYRYERNLPRMEGNITVGSFGVTVPVRIVGFFPEAPDTYSVKFCQEYAFLVYNMACMLADTYRGRGVTPLLRKYLAPQCIERLEFMWQLVGCYDILNLEDEKNAMIKMVPPMPQWIHFALVTSELMECTVNVNIGTIVFHSMLVFRRKASRWICDLADIG